MVPNIRNKTPCFKLTEVHSIVIKDSSNTSDKGNSYPIIFREFKKNWAIHQWYIRRTHIVNYGNRQRQCDIMSQSGLLFKKTMNSEFKKKLKKSWQNITQEK